MTSIGRLRDSDGFSRESLSVMLSCGDSLGLCCNLYGGFGVDNGRWKSLETRDLEKRNRGQYVTLKQQKSWV